MMEPAGTILSVDILEETAEELYQHAPCGYLSALPDGTIVRVNQTFLEWTGYSRERLLGKRFQELLTVAGKIFYETHYDPLIRMQGFIREMALELVCAGGKLLPVFLNSRRHQESAAHTAVIRMTVFDATERRAYERELILARRRAEQLATIVEHSADAILVMTPDRIIQTWNKGAERLFGYSAAEAVGQSLVQLIVPEEYIRESEELFETVRSAHQVQLETVRRHKNGTHLDVSLGLTPHIQPPGELTAISAIIRDISERRRIEARLRQAEYLESVATLAGGVAHEVNNQMAVVLGFGEFVRRALGSGHPQIRDVEAITGAAAKAARISRELLAFSRQSPLVHRGLNLSELVRKLAPVLSQELDRTQSLVIPERAYPACRVKADPDQLEQVLLQLTRNARDAMRPGGRLTINVQQAELTEADTAQHPAEAILPGSYVLLQVLDDGSGMDAVILRRAFEPFFTTKPFGQGTGLGLAMVHGIVKQHGGHVWADSELGKGTVVRIYLPLANNEPHG
ncbi:MAG TPA: PAS domain S-box protein [Gemmatimonadales bacterium]|nr:PAS domain S-box protein [Gemmatimonadales bacterium]